MNITSSIILIVSDIEKTVEQLFSTLPKHFTRVIKNEEEGKSEFLIDQAKQTIKEAYLASNETKYIILCGSTFRNEAQNSLLKVLEEPPKNIIFILITQSKSSILPTIFSRMPYKNLREKSKIKECELNLLNLELKNIYDFLKQHQRISKDEARDLIQSILFKAKNQNLNLNKEQLECFSNSLKLINLNSKPVNVITNLLLKF